ncbi:MAG: phage terminase large subunit, partial [Acidobacteria bacterium]|nr:phage terminase large subunit [Acidobacteriota bacterium]
MTTLTREAALAWAEAECARQSLVDYANLLSRDTYEQPPHVLKLIDALEAVERGDIRRLMVNMPPRGSKSMHCSRLLPSWWLGRRPADGVILASYGDTLAVDNGRAVRDFLQHPRYPFPASMRSDAKAAGRWYTNQGGGLIAVGRGAGLTGWMLPGNLIVPDDIIKDREEANSAVIRESAWSWWQEVLSTRLAPDGAIVFPSTRWHEDDVAGRILNSPGAADWTVLSFPYSAEEDDPLGREIGEPLTTYGYVPSVEKGEISSYAWAALYQQRPQAATGGMFKRAWFDHRYRQLPVAVNIEGRSVDIDWTIVQSCDAAWKEDISNDWSVIGTWALARAGDWRRYVRLDEWRDHVQYPDLKRIARDQFARSWLLGTELVKPSALLVEDAALGSPLIQEFRRDTGIPIIAVVPKSSKENRAQAVTAVAEAGLVWLPEEAEWVGGYIDEMVGFPTAAHDDRVDETTMALSR